MGSSLSSLVFQPTRVSYKADSLPLLWLRTASGARIPAFFIDRRAKVTLLVSHGNAEDLGLVYEWFLLLSSELKLNVLAYEYEGYGRSDNSNSSDINNGNSSAYAAPSESACYEDISAAFSFLVHEQGVPPESVILNGRSVGSGPTVFLAERLAKERVRLGGVILQSPIASIYRVALPFRWTLPGDQFCNIDRIHNVSAPLLVIHGTKDEIVPFAHGEELFLASKVDFRAKPLWIDGAGHNNLETFLGESIFLDQIQEFLEEWVPPYTHHKRTLRKDKQHRRSSQHHIRTRK